MGFDSPSLPYFDIMTDLQKHLRGILKILHQHSLVDDIRRELAHYLPASYGIASGRIVNQAGLSSESVQLLLYDKPLAGGQYTEASDTFLINHVLLVLDAAAEHTENSLNAVLKRITSVKALKNSHPEKLKPLPPDRQRERIPKHRLPFALVYCERFIGREVDDERFFERLSRQIHQMPVSQQPDMLEIAVHRVLYRNPLLDNELLTGYETGLSRTPIRTKPIHCYVCKENSFYPHFFYSQLCGRCADLNYAKRKQSADLSGKIALLTGGRVKIGFATALKLLRAGASVIVTSRFPRDAAYRYSQEVDFEDWQHRLHIYGLDLRNLAGLEIFVQHLYQTYPHLDILINNAAQTIRRPAEYYAPLLDFEQKQLPDFGALLVQPASMVELAAHEDSQNSWLLRIDEISMPEMVEVQLINAVAPSVLVSQLKTLLMRSPSPKRYIINVSAVEGQFSNEKNGLHPHTSMAKAALNMLTYSVAGDYAKTGIYMNSVDPGWVSDQISDLEQAELPLDVVDAAARICDPIFTKQSIYGQFLKDYHPTTW